MAVRKSSSQSRSKAKSSASKSKQDQALRQAQASSAPRGQSERPDEIKLPPAHRFNRATKLGLVAAGAGVLIVVTLVVLRISYQGRVYPGVSSYGLYLGGLNRSQAVDLLNQETKKYAQTTVLVDADTSNNKSISYSPKSLEANYDVSGSVDAALKVGRSGNFFDQIKDQTIYMIGRGEDISKLSYNPSAFASLYLAVSQALSSPLQSAGFSYQAGSIQLDQAQSGRRVDIASFENSVNQQLSNLTVHAMTVPQANLVPPVQANQISQLLPQAQVYVSTPIVIGYDKKSWTIDQRQISNWIGLDDGRQLANANDWLNHYYLVAPAPKLQMNQTAIRAYLNDIASQLNVDAVDAQLTVSDGRATVFAQARDGVTLNIDSSIKKIVEIASSKANSGDTRNATLAVSTTKANIRDDTISQLGITDLLSEGVTTFPGSSHNRLNNIKVGAARFQGVLIKPDETFSFGAQMGPVGPEQGYLPGLVILNDREENQYGGGMCQVSSTLFRAALLAGLPIVERHPHSFAVSFYTAPYGVPGVDAAIFYPGTDLKIKNDTGHYILLQTTLSGTTLKFDLYGTKTKSGQIRGPNFISGTNDPKVASETVFYRDILVGGQVVKTDTITSYYRSSLDFPVSD